MKPDRKQMMDERKSLMRESRQVRQAMIKFPQKGKREKNDVDPREVLGEIQRQMTTVGTESLPLVVTRVVMVPKEDMGRGNVARVEDDP